MDDGIYVTDKQGTTLFVNVMYEKLTGLEGKELLGRNVRDLKEKGIFDVIVNPLVVEQLKPVTHLQVLRSGKRLVLRGFPVFDTHNHLALVVTLVRDVTLIGQMREQILHQKDLISIYHDQIEHLHACPLSATTSYITPQIKKLSELVKRVAATDATILLLGETGVGKDWYARMAHENSPRREEVFLKVDCSSISENLIESELFGYAPGAFTGANRQGKIGHFEIANKGTVFLDEIGELPLPMQAKLLRVLQDQEVMRVGSSVPKKVDVRIIAATNRNLEEEVKQGNFRIDLFYRLRVAVIDIPPLREGREMIPSLVNHFLECFRTKYKKDISCHDETMNIFMAYRWPGNIRELENTIQSLVVTSVSNEILPGDLAPCMQAAAYASQSYPAIEQSVSNVEPSNQTGRSLNEIMRDFEKKVIKQVLAKHGSVSAASTVLGINRTTLFRKMRG